MGKVTSHDHVHTHDVGHPHAYGHTMRVTHSHHHQHASDNPRLLLTGEEYGVAPFHREHAHTNDEQADLREQQKAWAKHASPI